MGRVGTKRFYGKGQKCKYPVNVPKSKCGIMNSGRSETVDYEKVRANYNMGYSDSKIAELSGCSKDSVRRWRRKHRVEPNVTKLGMKTIKIVSGCYVVDHEKIEMHYNTGYSDAKTAKLSGCSKYHVRQWRNEHGLEPNAIKFGMRTVKIESDGVTENCQAVTEEN